MPRKSRSRKEHKSCEDNTLQEKAIESLVTILFVFASWITGKYNVPGLNGKIATEFCTQQGIPTHTRNVCCTVIDVEVSDDQKKSAQNSGVTLIAARRKPTLDPKRHPPKLEWLLHHEIYYPKLGDSENVKYVVGHDSMTADAAKDIRDSLFPDAQLYLLKVDLPGVLVVFDKWDVDKYGLPEFHRILLKDISSRTGKAVKVYATVLDVIVTETQREDAEKAGITLIPARRAEHFDSEDDPINIRWLSYPGGYYPQLKDLPKIQYVIGYAPMTAKAAAYIRKSLFPQAKLYQINAINPDCHTTMTWQVQHKLEVDMLNIAKESDAMVSIGPSMHDYFENAYRAIPDRNIPHIELLPKPGECFKEQTITLRESAQKHIILSYGEVHKKPDIMNDYSKIARPIGKVASAQKEVRGHSIKWDILDIPSEFTELEGNINKLTECDYEVAKLKPRAGINQILTHLKQSHLCVIGSCHTDYGFYGLETIAAGLPTYANRDSQLGTFITKYLKSYQNLFLVSSAQEWYEKLKAAVTDTATAFKWANELKKAYLECKEVDQSYSRFAALFTEGKEPSEDLPLIIELNKQPWKQHLKELSEQMEMMSRQTPSDKSAVEAIAQNIQDVSEVLKRCQKLLKRKADQMIDMDSELLQRLCYEGNVGVNQVKKIFKGSLGMLLNFLSILGLYRFKSSVQTGRFAELYEPWLITDEMRERAAKVNLPLKLQVTYEEKRFDVLDAFFIERDGMISESLSQHDGEIVYTFVKQSSSSLSVGQLAAPFSEFDTDIEDNIPVGARRVILFKLDKRHCQQLTRQSLSKLLEIDSSVVFKHLTHDVFQAPVEITESNRKLLLSKQEILYFLGVRKFFVSDIEHEALIVEALLEKHGIAVAPIHTITSTHSLLVRSLLLFDSISSNLGSYCDLSVLDLQQIRQGDRQYKLKDLEFQLDKLRAGMFLSETLHHEKLKASDRAAIEVKHSKDELDRVKISKNQIQHELTKARKENLELHKQHRGTLGRLERAESIAFGKIREIASLRDKTQLLEEQLVIAVQENSKIQEQLDRARKEEGVGRQANDMVKDQGKEFKDLEEHSKEKKVSGGFFRRFAKFINRTSDSQISESTDDTYTFKPFSLPPAHELKRSDITTTTILGEGYFGTVKKAVLKNLGGQAGAVTVAVKYFKLKEDEKKEKAIFQNELKVVSSLEYHPNVITLIGFVTVKDPMLLVFEFAEQGDLLMYLRNRRAHGISPYKLVKFTLDVANGMSYISSKAIIHRDLAARNVLVSGDTCKISDFQSSRLGGIYVATSQRMIPIFWTAPECLVEEGATYNAKTDVWSYGVLMWEIMSLGGSPYSGGIKDRIKQYLEGGGRLVKPKGCSDKIYEVMKKCWQLNPSDRPTFRRLANEIDTIHCDLTDHDDAMVNFMKRIDSLQTVKDRRSKLNDTYEILAISKPFTLPLAHELNTSDITMIEKLGEGRFGSIQKGALRNLGGQAGAVEVAVNCIKLKGETKEAKAIFEKELKVVSSLEYHPNVITFIGFVTERDPMLLVFEFAEQGELLQYLRRRKAIGISPDKLVKFTLDVAYGMSYLSSKAIIHRNLAARNILVSGDTCKISDFVLSRVGEICAKMLWDSIPVFWTAPECLVASEAKYNIKTDVWSYGVLMWEIMSLGERPYSSTLKYRIRQYLEEGNRLRKPKGCPDKIYGVMKKCWHLNQHDRPFFRRLANEIDAIHCDLTDPNNYVDVQVGAKLSAADSYDDITVEIS